MRQLKEKGYSKIYLWVLEKNERARRFYEKNGFTWNGDRLEGEEGGRKVTDLRYVLSFPKTKFSKQTKAVQSLPPMAAILNSLLLYRKLPVLPAARQPDGCDSILPKASSDRRAGFLRLF